MKKSTHWVGVFAMGIVSVAALSGCSGDPAPATTMGTAGATGMAGAGAGGNTGIQLNGPAAYTALTAADAPAGAAAPAAWDAKGCKTCHGPNGEGVNLGTVSAPSILGPEVRHTPTTYATWVVRHGRPSPSGMVDFPEVPTDKKTDVSAADLTAILTWLQAQPKPTTGAGLYKDFCGNCHGPNMGTGGAVPVSIVNKKMADVTMKVRGGVGTDPSLRTGYMPAEDAASLSDAELGLISQYITATP